MKYCCKAPGASWPLVGALSVAGDSEKEWNMSPAQVLGKARSPSACVPPARRPGSQQVTFLSLHFPLVEGAPSLPCVCADFIFVEQLLFVTLGPRGMQGQPMAWFHPLDSLPQWGGLG